MARRATLATLVLLSAVTAGCMPAASTSSAGSPRATETAGPESVAPGSPEAPTAPVASLQPSEVALEDWSSTELFLLAGLDPRFRATCAPTSNLPQGSSDGIDCKPDGVETMGAYGFATRDDMQRRYFARLAEHDVKADSGNGCEDGRPGEIADSPDFGWGPNRIGCYVDESGHANVRMTFPSETDGQSVYIGVVGRNGSIADLMGWLFPDYAPGTDDCTWCTDSIWSVPGG